MSVKIYNGFQVEAKSFTEAFRLLSNMRSEIHTKAQELTDAYVTHGIVDMIDRIATGSEVQGGDYPLWTVWQSLMDQRKEIRATQRRNPAVDTDFEIVLFPAVEDKIIGMVFTEQLEWQHWFKTQPFIGDYSYWDNSDHPEVLTEAEWDERGRVWLEDAGLDNGTPAECGVTMQLHPSFPLQPSAERVLELSGSRIARVEDMALRLLTNERYLEIRDPESDFPSSFIRDHNAALNWCKETPEGQLKLVAKKAWVDARLPVLTKDIILTGLPESSK